MKSMAAKFPGKCIACGSWFVAGTPILWSKGTGASHASAAGCAAALATTAPAKATPVVMSMEPVAAFLSGAKANGLKFPKARFLAPGGGELRLTLAGPKSKAPGAVNVLLRGEWVGRVNPTGEVVGRALAGSAALLAALAGITENPAAAAKTYGTLMGACSFCGLPLTDAGSIEAGYGPVCAKHWGLPHTAKGTPAAEPLTRTVPAYSAGFRPSAALLDQLGAGAYSTYDGPNTGQ